MELKLNMDEYLPLREVVFNTLRDAIVHGKFEPGERLMEISLANRLGVSRTPVREAIRMLELEGLVVMIPRRGAEVARITEKDLRDAMEIRITLEQLAVELACERIDAEGKERLKLACIRFREAISSKLVPAIVDADVAFHDVIFSVTKNPQLMNLSKSFGEKVYRYRVEYVRDMGYHDKLVEEHVAITNAILLGDVAAAKNIMRQHIYDQEQIVINNVKKKEENGAKNSR